MPKPTLVGDIKPGDFIYTIEHGKIVKHTVVAVNSVAVATAYKHVFGKISFDGHIPDPQYAYYLDVGDPRIDARTTFNRQPAYPNLDSAIAAALRQIDIEIVAHRDAIRSLEERGGTFAATTDGTVAERPSLLRIEAP